LPLVEQIFDPTEDQLRDVPCRLCRVSTVKKSEKGRH